MSSFSARYYEPTSEHHFAHGAKYVVGSHGEEQARQRGSCHHVTRDDPTSSSMPGLESPSWTMWSTRLLALYAASILPFGHPLTGVKGQRVFSVCFNGVEISLLSDVCLRQARDASVTSIT